MPRNFKNDTPRTQALGPNDRFFGATGGSTDETASYGPESIYNYMVSALATVASSGSASDLGSGTLPLGRLHSHLQNISNILAPAVNDVIYFNGSAFVSGPFAVPSGALASINNLSDVNDTSTARQNLGVEIGADVQAWDEALDDIAALAVADGNIIVGDGTNWVAESGATARASLGLTIGTHVQAYDDTLQSLSALGTVADRIAYTTALDTWAETALTSFARSILDDADEATFKATVNLEIGIDVQAYSAVLAATTASFTTADETKLDYITVTQAVDLDDMESKITALDQAIVLKGTWDASTGSFPGAGAAQAGWKYIVSVGGTVDGVTFVANDTIVAIVDNASTSTYAANWHQFDHTDHVLSVAGKTGAVTLQVADITDMSANGRSLVSAANYAAMRALLDLEVGTDFLSPAAIAAAYQPLDADLTALAGLTSAADKVPYFTGSGTAAVADFTASGRAMVAAASATAQTALLDAFTGDSGAGGVKGLVPAPATGDAAAAKFLKADGSWTTPAGGGDVTAAASIGALRLVRGDDGAKGVQQTAFQMTDPQGRLTLSTGVPVMISTVAATGTLYYTPYKGNVLWLYDGSTGWDVLTFSELSIALSAGTASRLHDVFVYNNAGTATLELTAWTNDTTRATALVMQDGRYVKTGATTRLYLGTVYLNGSKQAQWTYAGAAAGGSAGQFDVWNMYHRANVATFASDTTDSWTYTTDTWRPANNSTAMRVTLVCGLAEDVVDALNIAIAASSATSNVMSGVGLDSTSSPTGVRSLAGKNGAASAGLGRYLAVPGIGRHYFQALEYSTVGGTSTWFGDAGTTYIQSGLTVTFRA